MASPGGHAIGVAVSGGELRAVAIGGGPPVVLVHGTAPAAWGPLPAALVGSWSVVTYDRRSFGASRALAVESLSAHADDAAAVARACGDAVTLVGWSMGGIIAMEVAARHPGLVRGMVLLEPPFRGKRHPRPRMLRAILTATVLGRLRRPQAGSRQFLRWALRRRDGRNDFDAMPVDWHAQLVAGDAHAVVRELEFGTGEHLDARMLRKVAAPAHVLLGDRSDPVFAPAARRVADVLPAANLVEVPGAGHALQLSAPEIVAASVAAVSTT